MIVKIHIEIFFIIGGVWEQPRCSSLIKKMWYTIECYRAVKNNDIVKFAGTWMKLLKKSS